MNKGQGILILLWLSSLCKGYKNPTKSKEVASSEEKIVGCSERYARYNGVRYAYYSKRGAVSY
jgi:hypothetical protein